MVPRRQKSVLRLSSRKPVRQPVCACRVGRRAVSAYVWRLGSLRSALVGRQRANRLHLEPAWVIPNCECCERTAARTTRFGSNSASIAVRWANWRCSFAISDGPVAARVYLMASDGKTYAPEHAYQRMPAKSRSAIIFMPRDNFLSICRRAKCVLRRCEELSFNRQFRRWRFSPRRRDDDASWSRNGSPTRTQRDGTAAAITST